MIRDFENTPFLDNLVPLKVRINQNQTAGWQPGPPVHQGLGVRVHADQMIPVAEGIALAADITTPKVPGRYPAVVGFSAYSHQLQSTALPTGTNETGEAALIADHGYNHVVVSRRGMGRSQGESVIFFNETDVDDHASVIEWCAKQPWYDGNVVLFGTSYYGIVQPIVAARRPPALRGCAAILLAQHHPLWGGELSGDDAELKPHAGSETPASEDAVDRRCHQASIHAIERGRQPARNRCWSPRQRRTTLAVVRISYDR